MFSASSFYQLSTSIFLVMHKCAKILRNSSANVSKVRQKAIQICEHFISTRDNFITLMSPKTSNVDALFILRMLAFTFTFISLQNDHTHGFIDKVGLYLQ